MRNRSLAGLTAIGHPVVIVAALLLGFNAAIAQRLWPSWLTGKLGDVAWLIVAPLTCLALLELVGPLGRRLGVAVILGVGVAYALIKAWSPANAWVIDAFRSLGFPAKLVLDPTDLLALPALGLAVWIWLRASAETLGESRQRGLPALALAALALIADSPAPLILGETCLEARDGRIYGYTQSEEYAYFQRGPQRVWLNVYVSADGGATWSVEKPDADARTAEFQCSPATWPLTAPEADGSSVELYFVAGRGIYASSDFGETLRIEQPLSNALSALVDPASGYVVVAAGDDGIYVRSPIGVWTEITETAR